MILNRQFSPNIVEYYGESNEDLQKMPTTTKLGERPYEHALAPKGALARILTQEGLKVYMLRSTGWVEIANSSGGGGSGATSYNQLTDKPSINGVTLIENVDLNTIAENQQFEPGQSNIDEINRWFND